MVQVSLIQILDRHAQIDKIDLVINLMEVNNSAMQVIPILSSLRVIAARSSLDCISKKRHE